MTDPQPQFTALLSNRALHRLERMRIQLRRRFTNPHRGEHLAGRGGTSTEFSDYRDYVPGDDTRFVDWNIFARLHRPYIKLFHLEEELHILLLIDASTSMLFEDKLVRAAQLAAAFGVMGAMSGERVSAWVFRDRKQRPVDLPPLRGRAGFKRLFEFLESIEGGGDCPLEAGIESVLAHHRGRGAAMVFSDFLTVGDLKRPFNALTSAGLEVFALQILGPTEIDPALEEDVRLVDAETGRSLDVSSAPDLLTYYRQYRDAHTDRIASLARRRAGRFLSLSAGLDPDRILFELLPRKGWVR